MKFRSLLYPPGIFWEVTPFCNHNCIHCFNYWRTDSEKTTQISNNEKRALKDFADIIIERHPITLTITGGEPLLVWEELKPQIIRIQEASIKVSINSNAALVTDEIAHFLAERKISMFVSFPCCREEICDMITDTKGSFKKINDGLKRLYHHNVSVNCHMVVSSHNIDYVEETALYLQKQYGTNFMTASRVGKPVNASERFDGFLLNEEQIRRLIQTCVELRNKHGIKVEASVPYTACCFDTQEEFDLLGGRRLCSAGQSSYVIGSDGGIKSCPRDSEIFGNIFEEPFDVIWNRMEKWRDGSLYPAECKGCKSFGDCFAGCRADMLANTGKCNGLDMTARPDQKPFSKPPQKKRNVTFPLDQIFSVQSDITFLKEKEGYRMFLNGNFTYINDNAAKFLQEYTSFSKQELINYIPNIGDVDAVLLKLIEDGFIK